MGVPKFFRYTSERYPCLNELVKQYQIPDFDNMYLDMNGIIHNCSHPDDSNPHFRITEEKIFTDVFHYISILFQIVKPKKLFFMAIDGVAPRAKMNQQRGRRFRSAREAENLEAEAKAKGEVLPTEKRFDSNCITPGTVFMARLHEQLKYFVKHKMSTDPLWSKVKVILSGHETPGEGEHKIMDYIRWARSQPDYDPNTRHCLYGLDADLIMLGMCTHEPHFALLREEVKFGRTTQRATTPEETNFYLLHLSLLREYLEQEFIAIKDKLPFPYDIEKIVDDWVLMGFLVGNDFIPNLPNMHVNNDALPLLYNTYMTVLPKLDGYINEAGDLNLERFEIFMQELSKIDKEKFQDTYTDLKYFEEKTGRRPNANERREYKANNNETFNVDVNEIKGNHLDNDLQALINATDNMFMNDLEDGEEEYEETSDEEANMEMEFILHKKDYYMNKLDYSKVTDEVLADQAEGYVRAIQWNLYYYYKGCPSWCWFYPHHYAPYISDIKGFKDLKIDFELGEPFKPFEQLLAVLPAASKHLLPTPFHDLMTDEDSPIVHYYPVHFDTDLNGKINDWEAVVLIPFIDETNLLSAMAPCYQRLTDEEIKRNQPGPMLVYSWSSTSLGVVDAPQYFPSIKECHAFEKRVWRNELDVPEEQLKKGMLPNARRDMLFPGFPTMRHLKYKSSHKMAKVKVFDLPARNSSVIIELIRDKDEDSLERVANELLGKVIWVGWPHLTRAKVISVSNEKTRLHYVDKQNNNVNGTSLYTTVQNSGNLHKQWLGERNTIIEHNMNRLGIELGDVNIIVHAVNLKGYKYIVQDNCQMVYEPEWCEVPCGYAYQAVVRDVSAHVVQEVNRFSTLQEAYPPGDTVFLLTPGQYYGCLATVVESAQVRSGRIKVSVCESVEPTPVAAPAPPYKSSQHAAAACGVTNQMLSCITGCVFVVEGTRDGRSTDKLKKINIGLNLKFNKKNQEVAGYTRRCAVTGAWQYSDRCVQLVKDYAQNFPELFDKLASSSIRDVFFESDLWPGEVGEKKYQDVLQWIKNQPFRRALRRDCGSEALEPEEMKALADNIDKQLEILNANERKITMQVKWNLLYKAELHAGEVSPDRAADYRLYDRVVCVARGLCVPAGARGTVAALLPPPPATSVRLSDRLNAAHTYLVIFDRPFAGALHDDCFEENRLYRMRPNQLLNISYGRKIRQDVRTEQALEPFSYFRPVSLLRKDDGHHSAFASYSPPADKSNGVEMNSPPQDKATHLLRNLLRISEDNPKANNNLPSESNQSWRIKPDVTPPALPQPPRVQPHGWRKDASSASGGRPGPAPPNNWTNNIGHNNFKNPPPFPPVPTFNQPFPGPSQIPLQSPLQSRQYFNVQQQRPYQQNFPQHLPNVSANNSTAALPTQRSHTVPVGPILQNMKSDITNQKSGMHPNPPRTSDKVVNPFVPLQVQTSQRRVSQPSSSQRDANELVTPKAHVATQQQRAGAAANQQNSSADVKPQKKRKQRIAANLPFQED
ncbi:5'-3' exoribonuclease 1 [Bombyx mori]|uniref:5'-3' exoribonuclease 1 n=1 Tax=Bombyx mori TaxID=7091 RepID=A0A8R2GCM1_BOMMO|nr:5'-3' exoribonuclease 1 isoform X1 [Bombyx mori]